MHTRVGCAYRWRPSTPCTTDDLVRVERSERGLLVVTANAVESGFNTCWSRGSRLALDLFMDGWHGAHGDVKERLIAAFNVVQEKFDSQGRAIERFDDADDGPSATLCASFVSGKEVHTVWMGTDMVLGARNLIATWATTPHSTRAAWTNEGKEIFEHPSLDVPTRYIGRAATSRGSNGDAPQHQVFRIREGDAVVVVNDYVYRALGFETLAFIASLSLSPDQGAENIVDLAFASTNVRQVPFAVACVIRCEDVDVPKRIRGLIEDFTHPIALVTNYARTHAALPLVHEWTCSWAVTPEGRQVLSVEDTPDVPPTSRRDLHVELLVRKRLLELDRQLACLELRRPNTDPDCESCAEWAARFDQPVGTRGCPFCRYLGWRAPWKVPDNARPIFFPPSFPPAPTPDAWWKRVFG